MLDADGSDETADEDGIDSGCAEYIHQSSFGCGGPWWFGNDCFSSFCWTILYYNNGMGDTFRMSEKDECFEWWKARISSQMKWNNAMLLRVQSIHQ
jgi:hypothetical protein